MLAASITAVCLGQTKPAKVGAIPKNKPVELANFDNTTKPSENFYQYVNGGWLKSNPIPASESRWGAFSEVQEYNYAVLKTLLEECSQQSATAAAGSATQKIGTFYKLGMDSAKLEADGIAPIMDDLKAVAAIKSKEEGVNIVYNMFRGVGAPFFNFYAFADAKNSTLVVPQIGQGGLGMPDRDYYFKDDPRTANIRVKYKEFITRSFEVAFGKSDRTAAVADKIMEIEMRLAKVSLTRVERRDNEKTYNKISFADLDAKMPLFGWKNFFQLIKAPAAEYVIMDNPAFFSEVNNLMRDMPIEDWKTYLEWNVIRNAQGYLNQAMVNESFQFYSQTMQGTKEMKPRWKRVLNTVDGNLGELLGQEYCNRTFTPETKERCLRMVTNIGQTFQKRISSLDWMQETTKQKALQKLASFIKKIGYPDKWKDFSKLEIKNDSYYANIKRASIFEFDYMINKIGKPVDRTEWMMSPPTVNAYYNPSYNEIVFPAGILQPPFFNADADDAINYGGIGAVIGHEMTHGFDDEGRNFDADGNLKNWWTSEDSANFTDKVQMLVEQFNSFTVLDTVHVNGELTLGENIADLGGITISYEAFMQTLHGRPAPALIDGFTPQQRFFIGWAQVWRNNIRDAAMAQRIMTDPHSPGIYRCNAPLTNFPPFYEAFGIKPGDKMYREERDRAKIW